jgi:hypothetical protein
MTVAHTALVISSLSTADRPQCGQLSELFAQQYISLSSVRIHLSLSVYLSVRQVFCPCSVTSVQFRFQAVSCGERYCSQMRLICGSQAAFRAFEPVITSRATEYSYYSMHFYSNFRVLTLRSTLVRSPQCLFNPSPQLTF